MKSFRSRACIKYLMCFFNVVFLLLGISILIVGILTLNVYRGYIDFTNDSGTAIPVILITVGIISSLVSTLGFCGNCRESRCMLKTFVSILAILLILELAAGISGYLLRDKIDQVIEDNMGEIQIKYNTTESAQGIFNSLQQELNCCGVHNYTDWMGWVTDQPELVPYSCCKLKTPGCNIIGSATFDIHTNPCDSAVQDLLRDQIQIVAGLAIGVAFVNIFGVILGIRAVKNTKLNIPDYAI
ncbi:CD63 antigen-like [Lytechinus variegatus]|uniref:CD63 antigen-like n=1 Tax=Lytechinus variegatus TaxID=7654 RepID=UPI001BB1898B|nr:CD63 antigen-like [Lytechinus variegatus]